MRPHLTFGQLTLLIGTAVAIAASLILVIYALRKALRGGRSGEADRTPLRASDSSAFALATMQSFIANLKQEQRKLEAARRGAEQNAEKNARLLEVLAGALNEALVVFTREGFIRLINPAAREFLGADTWSRRRYSEILAPESVLANLIRACLETGKSATQVRIEWPMPNGAPRALRVTVLPLQARTRIIEEALCLLREDHGPVPRGANEVN